MGVCNNLIWVLYLVGILLRVLNHQRSLGFCSSIFGFSLISNIPRRYEPAKKRFGHGGKPEFGLGGGSKAVKLSGIYFCLGNLGVYRHVRQGNATKLLRTFHDAGLSPEDP